MSEASSAPDRHYSREEFRRWYEAQPRCPFERVDGLIVAMAPERIAHVRAKAAVYRALDRAAAAAGLGCEALADGATVETGDCDYQPDAVLHCDDPIAGDAITVPNRVVIVEVLSPGTQAVDSGAKLEDYFRLASVCQDLVGKPTRRSILHHRRTADGIAMRIGARGPIVLEPPGIVVTEEEIHGAE